MARRCEVKIMRTYKRETELFMVLIMGFAIGTLITLLAMIQIHNSEIPEEVYIPDFDMINLFCRSQGYDSGWLSSTSCGVNEVQCHLGLGNTHIYECVEWK